MPRKITYDKQCEALAEHFLSENSARVSTHEDLTAHMKLVEDLAQTIQLAIEDWLNEKGLV